MGEELARLVRVHKLMDDPDLVGALQVMVGEDMFLLLHLTMFVGTLEAMCNEEQVSKLSVSCISSKPCSPSPRQHSGGHNVTESFHSCTPFFFLVSYMVCFCFFSSVLFG